MKHTALAFLLLAACVAPSDTTDFSEGLLLSDQPGLTLAGNAGSQVGEDLAIGDIDGDGLDDLLLVDREYRRPTDEHQRGAVHIVYGSDTWSPLIAATDNTLEMPELGYGRDLIISFAGDVDGDGVGDFIVGHERGVKCAFPDLPISDDERYGEVYVVYGGPRHTGTRIITDGTIGAARLIDTAPCASAGAHVAGGADLDGDGLDDLAIVSSPRVNSAEVPGADRLYVIYGATQRLSGTLELPTRADLVISTSTASSNLAGLEAVGDLDGDGFDEFAVGEYDNSAAQEWMSVVRGYHQRRVGQTSLADVATRITGDVLMVEFNGVGDLDGDGFDDLAVTSPSYPTLFSLVYGRADLLAADFDTSAAAARLIGSTGWSSSSIDGGDVNGDGYRDLAIGDIDLFGGRGGAYVLSGSAARFSGDILLDDVAAVYAGNAYTDDGAVDFAGMCLGMGDFDGDGFADVAVGAPNNHIGSEAHRGHVYLLDGGAMATAP